MLTVHMQHLLKRLLPQFNLQRAGGGVGAGRSSWERGKDAMSPAV